MAAMPNTTHSNHNLSRMAGLAIAAAISTMALKVSAYLVTDSVGLLSDAVESSANLISAIIALFAVWFASRPVDRTHNYGHQKVEFFAGAIEGIFILIAAVGIAVVAFQRLRDPQEIEGFGIGVAVSIVATVINLTVARTLMRAGREHDSIAIDADGKHLMADVVTSSGVVLGLVLTRLTGIDELDPIIALLVAVNIVWTAVSLVRTGVDGLMDRALPDDEIALVRQAIEREMSEEDTFHALRTRRAGALKFVDFHLLVPGDLSVQRAHELTERIETAVAGVLPNAQTTVHIEPIEDPVAYDVEAIAPFEEADMPSSEMSSGHRPIAHAR